MKIGNNVANFQLRKQLPPHPAVGSEREGFSMRTLAALKNWTIVSWPCLAVFERSKRHYEVSGALAFEMVNTASPDLSAMAKAIRDLDYWYPWMDNHPSPSGEVKSIGHLSDGEVIAHNFKTEPGKIVWFSIEPPCKHLRTSQVYAYERYLAKIAKELAKAFQGAIIEVRSIIDIKAATSFK